MALVKTNDFLQTLLGLRNSFKKLVRSYSPMPVEILKSRCPRKGEELPSRLSCPRLRFSRTQGSCKTYEVQVVDDRAYAKTRDYVTEDGNIISSKYGIVSKDSKVMEMILEDAHLHRIGFLSHLQTVMKSGIVSLNGKKPVNGYQAHCIRRCRTRLLLLLVYKWISQGTSN